VLDELDGAERLQLMKFVCSFAWADLEIRPEEREFVSRLVRRLELGRDEAHQVEQWLKLPPPPEAVDPFEIPLAHREIFIEAVRGIIQADGEVAPEERESLALLEQLLRDAA